MQNATKCDGDIQTQEVILSGGWWGEASGGPKLAAPHSAHFRALCNPSGGVLRVPHSASFTSLRPNYSLRVPRGEGWKGWGGGRPPEMGTMTVPRTDPTPKNN